MRFAVGMTVAIWLSGILRADAAEIVCGCDGPRPFPRNSDQPPPPLLLVPYAPEFFSQAFALMPGQVFDEHFAEKDLTDERRNCILIHLLKLYARNMQ
ncbi:MAG: hypothetical protein HY231_11435 [Acidobacteria bacterium]|nr:hypothetical protein [Acidobacteriota bacterium]